MNKQLCVPEPADCDPYNDTCIVEDSQCDMCDRYNRPVTCLALFPVAVAVLIVALTTAMVLTRAQTVDEWYPQTAAQTVDDWYPKR